MDGTGYQSSRDCFRHPTYPYLETHYELKCKITPKFLAFEPTRTDLVIQEEYSTADQVNAQNLHQFNEWNRAHGYPIIFPSRLILLEPRTVSNKYHYLDGAPRMSATHHYYVSYPSMMADDSNCHQRIVQKPECAVLVTGLEGKLAFFDHVVFDPAHNATNYPGFPLQLLGTQGTGTRIPNHPYQKEKRQLTAAFVLFSLAASAISSAISGVVTGELLQKEMDRKIKDLEHQINQHFAQDEANLRVLAQKINALDVTNHAQDQAISSTITDLIKTQALQEQTDTFLQREISDNQRVLLQNVDLYMKSTLQTRTLSLSELELDKLIIELSSNLTGKPLFNKTNLYLTRISSGNMYLQNYAHHAETLRSALNNEIQHENETFDNFHDAIAKSRRNLNHTLININNDLNNKSSLINLSDPRWHPKPISVNLSITNLKRNDFANAFLDGIDSVPHVAAEAVGNVVDDVADIVGDGTRHLIGPIVGPIAAMIAIIVLIVVLKRLWTKRIRKQKQKIVKSKADKGDE